MNSITLSPVQVARAVDITAKQGLSELVNFQVANALKQPFQDESFDLVWSMESGEHMPDKKQVAFLLLDHFKKIKIKIQFTF